MSARDFDCIVIGAGVQGSFTAYHLAKHGKRALLLEQFVLPHSRGSSHGQTRIIRKAYEQDFYTQMMEECYHLWSQLEKEAGVKLYRQTGLLLMGPEKGRDFQLFKNTMHRNKIPTVTLEHAEFSQHIPQVNRYPGDGAIVDTTAGVLYADRALKAAQDVFRSLGGVIKDGEKVTDIKPGPLVTVTTVSSVYRAKSLAVKINVCYWRERTPGTYSVENRFPCFIHVEVDGVEHHIYGLPSNEYPGLMKVCYHMGSETDPDERDRQTDRSDIEIVSRYIAARFPGLVPVPAVVESCINIVIGAGFSGHGFKFGPIVGKVLGELALGQVSSYDLSPFRIRRFPSHSKSAL
ncbi:hypothetical protein JZ751_021393 [Albula glossodonta]|uniref:Peroxisomal sarcosine oxidase n=1 Tax=Albula glossodonta TaxID=121402 RepID=A0A8T2NNC1_9TELE|nr:hypothetical protein JZ751_021393 [Albula glossodonta]